HNFFFSVFVIYNFSINCFVTIGHAATGKSLQSIFATVASINATNFADTYKQFIPDMCDKSSFTMLDNLWNRPFVESDNGCAASHGLNQSQSKRFWPKHWKNETHSFTHELIAL